MTDREFLEQCLRLGEQAAQSGNPPGGAIIVRNGIAIAEGMEASKSKEDITCHAEIETLRNAVRSLKTKDLSDCTLYTTHEPCVMCSYAIRYYKIAKVVYIHSVPNLGGISSAFALLSSDNLPEHWTKPPILEKKEISD
ncbi:MAG: nucleoside deaminase [Chitinophagales bacterium]|nr:nucleoside deaminase [Chitinophagales bacterium]